VSSATISLPPLSPSTIVLVNPLGRAYAVARSRPRASRRVSGYTPRAGRRRGHLPDRFSCCLLSRPCGLQTVASHPLPCAHLADVTPVSPHCAMPRATARIVGRHLHRRQRRMHAGSSVVATCRCAAPCPMPPSVLSARICTGACCTRTPALPSSRTLGSLRHRVRIRRPCPADVTQRRCTLLAHARLSQHRVRVVIRVRGSFLGASAYFTVGRSSSRAPRAVVSSVEASAEPAMSAIATTASAASTTRVSTLTCIEQSVALASLVALRQRQTTPSFGHRDHCKYLARRLV